ncbi:Multidrug resistance protein MdtL [Pandoraea communis]|uniref:Multidrug resistance protein MdtL n=1 Tax=Pandoraea communis TaxID=2508297 RepID=A0A5E4Z0Q2_9BURK|nr:MFS transporter [Pandoraea communis]VVE54252.1 Multidrug resistance protein MdtL [Pandoraea communis]
MTPSPHIGNYPRLLASRSVGAAILWIDFTLIFENLAFRWNADAVSVGLAMMLYGLPGVLFGPWLGAYADRVCPWRLLRWSYVVRVLSAIALWQAPTLDIFLACVALKGLSNIAPAPAEQQLFRHLLDDNALPANAGRVTLIDQITKLVAPLVAAFTAYAGFSGFTISAALGVAGFLLVSGSRTPINTGVHHSTQRTRPLWTVFHSILRDHAVLRRVFIVTLCQAFILGFYDALLSLFLKARGYPDGTFGSIVGCTAAGAMIGAFVFRHAVRLCKSTTLLATSCSLFGLTILIPAVMVYADVTVPLPLMLCLWIGNGLGYGLGVMLMMVTFQRECPRETLGTVTSTGRSLQLLVLITAPLAGGALSSVTSIELVFLVAGVSAVGLGLFARSPLRSTTSRLPRPQ